MSQAPIAARGRPRTPTSLRGAAARRLLAGTIGLALLGCGEAPSPPPPGADADAALAAEGEFRAAQRAVAEAEGLPTSFTTEFGMRFELIPGGEGPMGAPLTEAGRGEDETPHPVRIVLPYYVATREVPQAAIDAWRGATLPRDAERETPAARLDHDDAHAFARWLTARDPCWAFRLPTEAEWEHAARLAGPQGPLEGLGLAPWEWCADRYGPYPDWLVTNPAGDEHGEDRVLRGGAGARIAQRRHLAPNAREPDVGLRLVAPLAYGKADLGGAVLDLRSVDTDVAGQAVREVAGFEVRLITILDRLSARQAGHDLVWQTIPRLRTPFRWHLPPGRYYAQCQVPGSEEERGVEMKVDADGGEVLVHLPTPRPGATLPKPQ